ncbi:TlpA family protein disulfide reductase [Brevibacillus halotolerans]|uniref:TlpA family protein disulfide reductase n=1 Tax=Brevibacillus halotolerans TaxID=1507437 RepID=UPI0015EEC869|nr:hypothetical protein [Brevibacillus halotolerans]MBA4533190.1 hypothetical protein [Brevibacillus halotolerans]
MSRINFKDLFTKKKSSGNESSGGEIVPFRVGEDFPIEKLGMEYDSSANCVFCFISLSCILCIDLLPQIPAFLKGYTDHFILVSDGTPEDNDEIAKYHEFHFPILSYAGSYDDLRIPFTPFSYFIDKNGKVIKGIHSTDTDRLFQLIT